MENVLMISCLQHRGFSLRTREYKHLREVCESVLMMPSISLSEPEVGIELGMNFLIMYVAPSPPISSTSSSVIDIEKCTV